MTNDENLVVKGKRLIEYFHTMKFGRPRNRDFVRRKNNVFSISDINYAIKCFTRDENNPGRRIRFIINKSSYNGINIDFFIFIIFNKNGRINGLSIISPSDLGINLKDNVKTYATYPFTRKRKIFIIDNDNNKYLEGSTDDSS